MYDAGVWGLSVETFEDAFFKRFNASYLEPLISLMRACAETEVCRNEGEICVGAAKAEALIFIMFIHLMEVINGLKCIVHHRRAGSIGKLPWMKVTDSNKRHFLIADA